MINTFLYWLIGQLYHDGARKSRGVGVFKLLNSAAHVLGMTMSSHTNEACSHTNFECNLRVFVSDSLSGYSMAPLDRVSGFMQLLVNIILYFAGVMGTMQLLRRLQSRDADGTVDRTTLLTKDGEHRT